MTASLATAAPKKKTPAKAATETPAPAPPPAPAPVPVVASPAPANAPPVGAIDKARTLFDQAQDAYVAHEFAKAAEGFKASANAFPSDAVLYNIASAYEMDGKVNRNVTALQHAVEYYGRYIQASPKSLDASRVTERISRLKSKISTLQRFPPTISRPVVLAAEEIVAARGLIVVESDPSDANVYLDDKKFLVGHTPWSGAIDGTHRVIVEKRGYVSHEHVLPTSAQRLVVYHADLKQDTNLGWMEINSPGVVGADIFIDNKDFGAKGHTPFAGNLPSGPHTFWISADGYDEYTEAKVVVAGENQTINAKLVGSPVGYVNVSGDGIDASTTLIDGNVACQLGPCRKPLPAGRHTLVVRRAGYKTLQRELQITAKSENAIKVTLAPEPSHRDAILLYAVAGVFGGVAIATGLHSESVYNELQKAIIVDNPHVERNDPRFNRITEYAVVADISYGLAALALGSALYYTFRNDGAPSTSTSDAKTLALTPALAPGYAGIDMQVRW